MSYVLLERNKQRPRFSNISTGKGLRSRIATDSRCCASQVWQWSSCAHRVRNFHYKQTTSTTGQDNSRLFGMIRLQDQVGQTADSIHAMKKRMKTVLFKGREPCQWQVVLLMTVRKLVELGAEVRGRYTQSHYW